MYENNTVGSTVTYVCERGYSLEGEPAAECTRDGRWSNPLPLCKRVCLFCNGKVFAEKQQEQLLIQAKALTSLSVFL